MNLSMTEKIAIAHTRTRRSVMLGMVSFSSFVLPSCVLTNSNVIEPNLPVGAQAASPQPVSLSAAAARYGVTPISYTARRDGEHFLPTVYMSGISQEFHRQVVQFDLDYAPGTIVVNNETRQLFLVLPEKHALRYGISVGAEGMTWRGRGVIYRRSHWPTWTPTPSMILRDPSLRQYASGMPGGRSNPLGARALYLMTGGRDNGYRIHGTPNWRSIGHYASSGCIRMINQDVIDLYERVPNGSSVISV